jgi:hypothetical protein
MCPFHSIHKACGPALVNHVLALAMLINRDPVSKLCGVTLSQRSMLTNLDIIQVPGRSDPQPQNPKHPFERDSRDQTSIHNHAPFLSQPPQP